ncbi:MAG: hypothetical protein A2173_08775 [Planctomycetes bacterium RBG_13_44_8b]|nr:MAG: hypothetical protein A2173_08775 [Planctomycetes bacterium RBG_13_44_8b]
MKRKRIKYVSLESGAFISDLIFQTMSAEERGVYCTLLLYLYENNGKLPFNIELLKSLCNCTDFEKSWDFIKQKFTVKNGKISHKRVTKELNRAKLLSQTQSQKAVKAAKARWNDDASSIPQAFNKNTSSITKRSQANQSEDKVRDNTKRSSGRPVPNIAPELENIRTKLQANHSSQFNSVVSSPRFAQEQPATGTGSSEPGLIDFYDRLVSIFAARTASDTTSLRNLAGWVRDNIAAGRFNEQIIPRILEMAADSKTGKSIKPIAVFFARVKRELGYRKDL